MPLRLRDSSSPSKIRCRLCYSLDIAAALSLRTGAGNRIPWRYAVIQFAVIIYTERRLC